MEKTPSQPNKEELLTRQQQKALHVWFEAIASVLNAEGKTMALILNKFILDAPVTKYSVKELIWKPLQASMYGKESTTELLKKKEIDQIVMALSKFFGEEIEVSIPPFPSSDPQNY